MKALSEETLAIALDATAHLFRQSLMYHQSGFRWSDVQEGTWPAIYGKAVEELWAATGGAKVGQYVLATENGSVLLRRYRIAEIFDSYSVATEAWSSADELARHTVDNEGMRYIG